MVVFLRFLECDNTVFGGDEGREVTDAQEPAYLVKQLYQLGTGLRFLN